MLKLYIWFLFSSGMYWLQAHTETVNMLVSEKSSLQAQVNHLQTQLSDKISKHYV